jgi:hypothetical protein
MKKSLLLTTLLGFNCFVTAQDYKVTSQITVADQVIGSPVLVVKEGITAKVKASGKYDFSVNVKPENDSQVLLNLIYIKDEFERSTSVIFDINEKLKLKIGEQSFEFTIDKVSS